MNEREEFEKWFKSLPVPLPFLGESVYPGDLLVAFQAGRASLPVKVPDGWQLVPKEPTEEMLAKGHNQIDFDRNEQNTYELEHPSQLGEEGEGTYIRQDMLDCWGAMLAAAPKEGRE